MDQYEKLSVIFTDNEFHRIRALRTFTLHRGTQNAPYAHADGLTIFMRLFRHLISLNFAIDPIFEVSACAKQLMKMADLDIGWEADKDRKFKQMMMHALETQDPNILFADLIELPKLRCLIQENLQFKLISPYTIEWEGQDGDDAVFIQGELDEPVNVTGLAKCTNSGKTVSEQLSSMFAVKLSETVPTIASQQTCLRPRFIRVQYSVDNNGEDVFAALQQLKIKGREVVERDDGIYDERIILRYNLCAVIRVTKYESERIRLYGGDYKEIVPSEIGEFKEKEDLEKWSVDDSGQYLLFYVITDKHERGEGEEYRGRSWER